MIKEICRHLTRPTSLKEIVFVLYEHKIYGIFSSVIEKYLSELAKKTYRNPIPTVDIIIEVEGGIILIKRKNPPFGWALPGGFVDYGESVEEAAIREAKEETGLDIKELKQFRVYSRPDRDPRLHTISTVFIAKGEGTPKASDDAKDIGIFNKENLPENIAFDHKKILGDYFRSLELKKLRT
ncbi:MAG TPA: NUDIX domain-containing protein [Firmicutes bacterium]|nr:MAG: NUDIX hydrolase [Candidatus Omnitrophota bacterium]HDD64691.1 NUDIX domain-containing protein [Bacillota bacterium]